MIFKNISDDFLVANGSKFFKYSLLAFSIIFLNEFKFLNLNLFLYL